MIIALAVVVLIGVLAGAGADELLRGRDPRSARVIVAGLVGAIVGLVVRRETGSDGVLIGALSGLFGALLVAFIVRIRLSTAIARLHRDTI